MDAVPSTCRAIQASPFVTVEAVCQLLQRTMVWHDEFPLQRSRGRSDDSGSFQLPSANGSLGNGRLSPPVNGRKLAITALIFTVVVVLALLCTILAIVVRWRQDEDKELVYLRSILDELSDSHDIHDDPPEQNTAPPVPFLEGGTNPPTRSTSIPSMAPSVFSVSNSPSAADSAVPTDNETPQPTTATPVANTMSPVADSPSQVDGTPSPVNQPDTPAPAGETVSCTDQYTAFLMCIGENEEACISCDVSLPGELVPEGNCEVFSLWLEGNVECCTGDECGDDLFALETCKNCPGFVPSAPFAPAAAPFVPSTQATPAPVIQETLVPVIDETLAPAIDETAAPVVGETTAPVIGENLAPIEVPATPSPVDQPESETLIPIKEETGQPVAAPSLETPSGEWSRVGQDITWTNTARNEATSLVMSGDGTTLAVGQSENGINSNFGGQVDVYRLNEDGTWTQLGRTIESDLTTGLFGYGVSLNEDGSILAISEPDDGSSSGGRVIAYELNVDTWQQRGQVLDGGGPDQFAGGGVVLSEDGNTILYDIFITARQPGASKFVRVFRYNGSNWEKVGQDVFAQVATLTDTLAIDLSGDGSKFALAAIVPGFGYCETYELRGNAWEVYGKILPNTMTTTESVGLSVALDRDGSVLAVGIRKFQTSNCVRAYSFDDEWVQLGDDIDSEGSVSSLIIDIDLSPDGQTLAIGPQEETMFASVHSYDLMTDNWSRIGDNIDADLSTTGTQIQSVSLAESGPRIAVFGVDGDNVKVYDPSIAIARKRI